jgi:Na+-driven multidrug efflux pump
MTETRQENKMGVMPIPKLLISMSLPMIASMLVQALYNIVDSMFVAQLNENALTAVSLAFPIQNLMIAVAAGTGVGINALLSKSLGEKNYEGANKIANNGILLAVLSSLVFAIATALGFALALILFAGMRERLSMVKLPKAMQGMPTALITAGLLAMAFMGFSGVV